MVIEVTVNIMRELIARKSKLRNDSSNWTVNIRLKVKGNGSIQEGQKLTANKNMLKRGIAVMEMRTVSILQEIRQRVIQTEPGIKGYRQWS